MFFLRKKNIFALKIRQLFAMYLPLKHLWCYLWKAQNEHSLHSPFVYELYTQVIKPQGFPFYAYQDIENLREMLLDNDEIVELQDFGAGSRKTKSSRRSIRQIVITATIPPKTAQMLFRLINFLQPSTVIELGTSLGITTAYLAKAMPLNGVIYSFEGASTLIQMAEKHLKMLQISNVKLIQGNIDCTLPQVLSAIEKVDFALIDANHRYKPTLNYFEQITQKCHENSAIVIDDIRWSAEMSKAWERIYTDTRVGISIELFRVGIVFFRNKQPKQHFILRF